MVRPLLRHTTQNQFQLADGASFLWTRDQFPQPVFRIASKIASQPSSPHWPALSVAWNLANLPSAFLSKLNCCCFVNQADHIRCKALRCHDSTLQSLLFHILCCILPYKKLVWAKARMIRAKDVVAQLQSTCMMMQASEENQIDYYLLFSLVFSTFFL